MAVTCSFKKKLGHIWLKGSDDETSFKADVWAGGNCMLVCTWGKQKSLQFFFSDMKHLRACAKDDWLEKYISKANLSVDLSYAKDIALEFAKHGVPCTLSPQSAFERRKRK